MEIERERSSDRRNEPRGDGHRGRESSREDHHDAHGRSPDEDGEGSGQNAAQHPRVSFSVRPLRDRRMDGRVIPCPRRQWRESKEIQPTFITFRDLKLEWDFMRQPDMLIKYTVLAATFLVFILGIVEILSQPESVLPLTF